MVFDGMVWYEALSSFKWGIFLMSELTLLILAHFPSIWSGALLVIIIFFYCYLFFKIYHWKNLKFILKNKYSWLDRLINFMFLFTVLLLNTLYSLEPLEWYFKMPPPRLIITLFILDSLPDGVWVLRFTSAMSLFPGEYQPLNSTFWSHFGE